MLWVPLFENSENSEETTRNVAAACLGKLATTHPSRYLPQLHVLFFTILGLPFQLIFLF
jgi:cullin-associated NEDD8-dissociated protein 1